MSYSIDKFFNRRLTKTYNCFDFVREVWLDMTGEDIVDKLTGLQGAFPERKVTKTGVAQFTRLEQPRNPCIVAFSRKHMTPHVGVWYQGRVLHLHPTRVEWMPLSVVKYYFKSIRFYA